MPNDAAYSAGEPTSSSRPAARCSGEEKFFGEIDATGFAGGTAVLRSTINRLFPQVQGGNGVDRERVLTERETYVRLISYLYLAGSRFGEQGVWRVLRASEVEAVLAVFKRLAITQGAGPEEVTSWCAAQALKDTNAYAHCIDPLQLRHLLTFYRDVPQQELGASQVEALRAACRAQDAEAIRGWFETLGHRKIHLPKGTAQFLRQVLHELWSQGAGGLELFAFELAVLETRMFDVIGWENMRSFCSLLKRISGSTNYLFSAYLTDEDIDEALMLNGEVDNAAECAYYRELAAAYQTRSLRELQRSINAHAAHRETHVPSEAIEVKAKTSLRSRLLRNLGLPDAASA